MYYKLLKSLKGKRKISQQKHVYEFLVNNNNRCVLSTFPSDVKQKSQAYYSGLVTKMAATKCQQVSQ